MSRLCPDSVPGCWSHLSAAAASSAATARAFGAGCGGTGARCRLTEGPALHCPGGATETQAAPQTAERAPHLTRSSEPAAALRCGGGRRKGSSYPSESCGKEQVEGKPPLLHRHPRGYDKRCQRTVRWSLPVMGGFCTGKRRREVSPGAAGGTRGRLATGPSRAFASKAWRSGVTRDGAGVQSGKTRRVERSGSASTQTALETVQIHPGAAGISVEVFVNRASRQQDANVPASSARWRLPSGPPSAHGPRAAQLAAASHCPWSPLSERSSGGLTSEQPGAGPGLPQPCPLAVIFHRDRADRELAAGAGGRNACSHTAAVPFCNLCPSAANPTLTGAAGLSQQPAGATQATEWGLQGLEASRAAGKQWTGLKSHPPLLGGWCYHSKPAPERSFKPVFQHLASIPSPVLTVTSTLHFFCNSPASLRPQPRSGNTQGVPPLRCISTAAKVTRVRAR